MPEIVLWGGIAVSVLLSGILWSAAARGSSAIALARRVTVSLRESEERLQAILDNTSAVVYLKDLNGRYLLVNHRFEQLFGKSQAESLGKTDDELFPVLSAATYRENDRRVLATGQPLEVEEPVSIKTGLHIYISNKFALLDHARQALRRGRRFDRYHARRKTPSKHFAIPRRVISRWWKVCRCALGAKIAKADLHLPTSNFVAISAKRCRN